VPLAIPPAAGVAAIVETYKTPAEVFANIRRARRIVVGTALAGGALLQLFFTTKSQGTGLGLALARKFIEAYGGALAVRSAPGQGAAFRASFRVAAAA
jgi:hypothetical protein